MFFVQLSVTNFDPHEGQRKGVSEEEEVVVASEDDALLLLLLLLLRESASDSALFREGCAALSRSSSIIIACFYVTQCAFLPFFSRAKLEKSDIPRATDRHRAFSLSLSRARSFAPVMKKKKPLLREEEERRVFFAKTKTKTLTTTSLLFQFLNPIDSELHRLSTKIEAECFPLLREREIPIIATNEDEDGNGGEDFDDGAKKKDATAGGVVSLYLFIVLPLCFCFCI